MFVDYENGSIVFGVGTEPERLERLIEGLEEEVQRLRASWASFKAEQPRVLITKPL